MTDLATKTFKVYGNHKKLFAAKDEDEVVLSGAAGTGKSYACLLLAHLYCLQNPGVRVLFVRKTLESLKNTGVVTYREHIIQELIDNKDIVEFGGSNLKPPSFNYSNGSTVLLGGMDNPGKVLSAEYDLVYVQEATQLTLTDWEILTTRIRNGKAERQQLIGDCNPDSPTHWLKIRANMGNLKMIPTVHKDNPAYFDQTTEEWTPKGTKFLRKLQKMTGIRRKRYYEGLWSSAEGLIYSEFNEAIHVLPSNFKIPRDWDRYWAIDFGFNNPFVLQMWAEDPDGSLYLYKEIYRTKRIVEDHARFLMNRIKSRETGEWLEPRPKVIVADHDAEGRVTFSRHTGLSTTTAKKDVIDGLQKTMTRFPLGGNNKPRIYFLENAVMERDEELEEAGKPCSTLEEITGYVWDKNTERASGKPEKEAPLKQNDHGMDAMRYIVMERDRSSRPGIRVFR